jgi:hypothetical protein
MDATLHALLQTCCRCDLLLLPLLLLLLLMLLPLLLLPPSTARVEQMQLPLLNSLWS